MVTSTSNQSMASPHRSLLLCIRVHVCVCVCVNPIWKFAKQHKFHFHFPLYRAILPSALMMKIHLNSCSRCYFLHCKIVSDFMWRSCAEAKKAIKTLCCTCFTESTPKHTTQRLFKWKDEERSDNGNRPHCKMCNEIFVHGKRTAFDMLSFLWQQQHNRRKGEKKESGSWPLQLCVKCECSKRE